MLLRLDGDGPLHRQLYRSLRAAILSGRLARGAKLPSTRSLAEEAGVSRNVALLAYDQLLGEGYATARRGSGTYVPETLPDEMIEVARTAAARASAPRPTRLSRFARRLRGRPASWAPRSRSLPYDFRYGRPAFADFPHEAWSRIVARRARRATTRDLDYGPPAGLPALRRAIAGYLTRSRAVVCRPEQVLVVRGSQQALDLAARLMLDAGDRVLLEEPHYAGARRVFLAAGADVRSAAVDDEGFDVARFGAAARQARLAYVTPSHQFPTGVVMSLGRRLALLGWAQRAAAYVLEDDYDSEYRYAGRPIESLQGLDGGRRVLYVGTFSKLLFPALRLGYLVLPEPLVETFVTAKALADTGTATLEQLALAEFIDEGHFERHVRRSRARNATRRAVLLEAIAEHLGDRVQVSGAEAGIHVVAWLRRSRADDAGRIERAAAASGVGVYSLAPFHLRPPARAGFLLGYSSLGEREIREGIRRLGQVLGSAS